MIWFRMGAWQVTDIIVNLPSCSWYDGWKAWHVHYIMEPLISWSTLYRTTYSLAVKVSNRVHPTLLYLKIHFLFWSSLGQPVYRYRRKKFLVEADEQNIPHNWKMMNCFKMRKIANFKAFNPPTSTVYFVENRTSWFVKPW